MRSRTRDVLTEYAAFTRRGTEALWGRVKRWFIVAAVVGVLVGLGVTALDYVVYELLWGRIGPAMGPVTVIIFPTLGLALSGFLLERLTREPLVQGTDEVIEAFHERAGRLDFRSFPGKLLAAVATLGLGGSAGMEGPSIYLGGTVGSWVIRRIRRFGFTDEDVRTLLVAGSAAGISAVFKAPLTGIVFALEVPYMDDLARESLIPSMIASVSSYLVLVQFLGVQPLFFVEGRYVIEPLDLLWSLILGVVVGLLARAFVMGFHFFRRFAEGIALPLWVRTGIGGLVTGAFGLLSLILFSAPVALGTGYESIGSLVTGLYTPVEAVQLLVLKAGATTATLASGAAGGVFIPLIMLGAASGAMLQGVLPRGGALFPVVGMAAFLAAAYNAPIAATVFVAETTGGAGYLIPGLVGAAAAYTVAGRISISTHQRWRREGRIERLMRSTVGDVMTEDATAVSADATVGEFVTEYVVGLRHKSFPVIDGEELVGMVSVWDVRKVEKAEWSRLVVGDVMSTDLITATPDEAVGALVERMSA